MVSPLSDTEKEIVILTAAWGIINDMVNYEMFTKPDSVTDVTLLPSSSTHQRLFNILLVDFLSSPNVEAFGLLTLPAQSRDHGYLFHLQNVCAAPKLDVTSAALKASVDAFISWLDTECVVERVWFPSIDTELDLKLKRVSFIKICGNISKHNFLRLSDNVRKIQAILKDNGVTVDINQAYLVLPEFYEWFHNDILNYHMSAIAEFLNDIRWGMYDYLKPEFERFSTKPESISPASPQYPDECKTAIARSMYLDLIYHAGTQPYMPRFEVTKYLKMRY